MRNAMMVLLAVTLAVAFSMVPVGELSGIGDASSEVADAATRSAIAYNNPVFTKKLWRRGVKKVSFDVDGAYCKSTRERGKIRSVYRVLAKLKTMRISEKAYKSGLDGYVKMTFNSGGKKVTVFFGDRQLAVKKGERGWKYYAIRTGGDPVARIQNILG